MRIQHNIMAMNAYRNYSNNTSALSKNLERLSSGYKINRAGDDAAGLAISEKMRAQITGLEAAQKNVKDGISLVNTAEGAMQEIQDMLNRMVYLATQSANGTYDNEVDRLNLQKEVDALKTEINRIADSANFNGIKLMDGTNASGQLSRLPVEYNTVSASEGVSLESGAGVGSNGKFTLDLNSLHGTGDTITVTGKAADGTTALSGGTLTYGASTSATTFTGDTVEEQAKSIADALKLNADYAANFDITAEGSKVVLTAKAEGTEAATIENIVSADKTVTLGADTVTAGAGAGTAYKGGFTGLFSTNAAGAAVGINAEVGDVLKFAFKDAAGKDLTVSIEVTKDMLGNDGKVETFTANVAKKLENAYFDDNADTGADESKLKVSDLFTITANKANDATTANSGGLAFTAKGAGATVAATSVTHQRNNKDLQTIAGAADAGTTAADGTAAEKHVIAAGTNNFTAGDVFKMSGKLSDGQDFSVELVAGKDFEIGASYNASITNIKNALTGANSAKITVGDKKVDANTVFGSTATKHEFNVTDAAGALTVESTRKGVAGTKGYTGSINSIEVKTAPEAASKFTSEPATAKAGAYANITLEDGIKENTAIQIGDKTYEIVTDSRNVTSRNNEAVVVTDLENASVASIAQALADKVDEVANKDKAVYNIEVAGNTVKISTVDEGKDVAAIKVDTPYDQVTEASFQFDPAKVSEGAILKFNDKTYEFVQKGGKAKNSDAIAVEVDDFKNATSKSLAEDFAAVLKNGTAKIADDGTITLRSNVGEDGTIITPEVSFENSLTLQIGDTSDAYNQLEVPLKDMHTKSLGIDGINIGTQPGARAAIDVIRDAINHVSSVRGDLGAISNRLDHTANNLSVMRENITDAESSIRDTDIAEEMMAYTKNNILVQSAQAMLAQANQVPQGVLQLLQ